MNLEYYELMGWTLVLVAAIFTLGLASPFARHFYPGSPGLLHRLAAPLIFGVLAGTCFLGMGHEVLALTVLIGVPLIVADRWKHRSDRHAV